MIYQWRADQLFEEAMTEFKNCFIIQSQPEFVFVMNIFGKRRRKAWFHLCIGIDCLQSVLSLKIHLVLDLIQRDCKPRCYYIYRDRDETRKDRLLTFL